jgi:hypothetical protein
MSPVEKRKIGFASVTLGTMRTVGQGISMAAALLLTSIFVGPRVVTPAHPGFFLSAMRTVFVLFAFFCFLVRLARAGKDEASGRKRGGLKNQWSTESSPLNSRILKTGFRILRRFRLDAALS